MLDFVLFERNREKKKKDIKLFAQENHVYSFLVQDIDDIAWTYC